ncbi:hypothetical protein MY3957_006485 [Beauveria namnaoensis]
MTPRPRNHSPLKKQSSTPGQQPSDVNADGAFPARFANGSQLGRGRCLPLLPSPFDSASFKPLRPCCTNLRLRSLAPGNDSADHDCADVLLHSEAARRIEGPAADGASHPIGLAKLAELAQLQLLNNVEQDCECLLSCGPNGAIGCLFRVTVTGFGYTLVSKGVQTFHSHRIRHEAAVYKQPAAQQGIPIPVLLLSYAGTPLYSPALRRRHEARQVDVDAEASRTLEELQALGVEDGDDTSNGNPTWCSSSQATCAEIARTPSGSTPSNIRTLSSGMTTPSTATGTLFCAIDCLRKRLRTGKKPQMCGKSAEEGHAHSILNKDGTINPGERKADAIEGIWATRPLYKLGGSLRFGHSSSKVQVARCFPTFELAVARPLAEKSPGSVDTPIISRQPLDDLRPDRAGAPPTASYGAGLEELPECKVEKDDYMITGP